MTYHSVRCKAGRYSGEAQLYRFAAPSDPDGRPAPHLDVLPKLDAPRCDTFNLKTEAQDTENQETLTEKSALRRGRPLKYKSFLLALEDDTVYTPSSIVLQGEAHSLFDDDLSKEDLARLKLKIRHTLARFSANNAFPPEGDGLVHLKGQAPMRGWTGKRWKAAIKT